MNISTLSQQLNISVQELRQKMKKMGYKVNPRQRKIDNDIAQEVIDKLGGDEGTQQGQEKQEKDEKKIVIPPHIVVKDLAAKLNAPPVEVVKTLINNGVMAAITEEIDFDTASVVASEYGYEVEMETNVSTTTGSGYVEQAIEKEYEDEAQKKNFITRPPIVTVMGHVDHGKTTLLDTLRKTNVAEKEAGAITQHIGAYQVEHKDNVVTFLDTPGHEAFTQMRARGANVTDIIILVVAADDGVKPQTIEVINRARLSGVPMIVAINKVDKPEADPERIKQQLSEHNVIPEEWSGKTIVVPISAKSGKNLDQLLDYVSLVAEVEDLKANPKGEVVGTVIESHIARGKGSIATVVVQNGTLKVGDVVVAGPGSGRIKSLEDDRGEKINQAKPGDPAVVAGLSEVPKAGDILRVVSTLDEARELAKEYRSRQRAREMLRPGIDVSGKTLNLILRADVQGSIEAIEQSLEELKSRTEEVQLNIIDKEVGQVTESDVVKAESAGATIIGFNVNASPAATSLAKSKGVKVDLYNVIYELIEDVTKVMVSMLSPEVITTTLGTAKVLAVFKTSGKEQIVGGRVENGKITNHNPFIIKREGEKIGTGEAKELQHNKISIKDVTSGNEFGLSVEVTEKIQEGDVLEFYSEEVKQKEL